MVLKILLLMGLLGLTVPSSLAYEKIETWQPGAGYKQITIWPKSAPDRPKAASSPESIDVGVNLNRWGSKPVTGVYNVTQPTMTVYAPKGASSGAAVVVFPGGGYQQIAIDLEGTEVCDWLTPKGVTCIVLKYRVPASGPYWDEKLKHHVMPQVFTALQDAQRTMGLVRHNAVQLKINPKKIGVIGFSAGGNLVAAISTNFKERIYAPVDESDRENCRPDFAMALYPGHMSVDQDDPKKDLSQLNPDLPVTSDTPPTFIVHAVDDPVDPVEYATLYFAALKKAKVPVEMHLYAQGGHAFALRRKPGVPATHWMDVAEGWLGTIGVLPNR